MLRYVLLLSAAMAAANADSCRGKTVPSNMCATLFDDDDCGGWALNVPTGYTELSYWKKNDAEAVVVKAGCRLIGYDHASSDVGRRGDSVTIDARHSSSNVARALDDDEELEEMISAVQCDCSSRPPATGGSSGGSGSFNPGDSGSGSFNPGNSGGGRPNFEDASGSQRPGNARGLCDNVRFQGNVACMAYDDGDCELDDWSLPVSLRPGERRRLTSWAQRNDIESVSVKAGCSLKVWKDDNYSGDSYVFHAPPYEDRHDTLDRDLYNTYMFSDNIESLECSCT